MRFSALRGVLLFMLGVVAVAAQEAGSAADRDALAKTSAGILDAFAKGDAAAFARYHHPDVEKALSYTKILKGREAVVADFKGTSGAFALSFIEHHVESLRFVGNVCIEQTAFAVRGEPKAAGQPFTFRGRAVVVYVRWPGSPTGWASIHEIVQPAP